MSPKVEGGVSLYFTEAIKRQVVKKSGWSKVVYSCFFAEIAQATPRRRNVTLRAVLKVGTQVTAEQLILIISLL